MAKAIVHYEDEWPWPGQPWPWCEFAERSIKFWPQHLVRPAIAHDNHQVNEGNTWCPGYPGEIEGA